MRMAFCFSVYTIFWESEVSCAKTGILAAVKQLKIKKEDNPAFKYFFNNIVTYRLFVGFILADSTVPEPVEGQLAKSA